MVWQWLCPVSPLDYFLTFLPLVSGIICGWLTIKFLRVAASQYLVFLVSASMFAALILTPLLIIPTYGVIGLFYIYPQVLHRYATLAWQFNVLPKDQYKLIIIYLGFTWFNIAVWVGPLLTSRILGLQPKKSSLAYVLFVYSTILLTYTTAWGVSLVWA